MEILFGARASSLGTWASHPIAVWFKKEINGCVRGTSVLSINDALMNETISATHEGKHAVYLFMQTGPVTLFLWWRREVRAPYSAGA